MESVFAVSLMVGVVIWLLVRAPKGHDGPTAGAGRGPAAQSLPAALPAIPSLHDDGAFFDGYVWGRLQERHDERQHDDGHAGGDDHDMFDGDDGYDDDS